MRDYDIRTSLRVKLGAEHEGDPNTLIVEELGVCQGESRVDMAVVNGSLHGYEIKSERDNLDRLPKQSSNYGRCFDNMTLVVSGRHVIRAMEAIPEWWGVVHAMEAENSVRLDCIRDARDNPGVDGESVVQLLWREEALDTLAELGLAKGLRSRRRRDLWNALAKSMPLDELRSIVRSKIKARGDWRSEMRQARCSGLSPTLAIGQHSQANLDWLLSLESPDRRD